MKSVYYFGSALFAPAILFMPSVSHAQSYMDQFQDKEPEEEEEEDNETVASIDEPPPPESAAVYVDPPVYTAPQSASDPVLEELRALREDLEVVGIVTTNDGAKSAQLEAINTQLALLDAAVKQGLDPEVAAVSRATLEAEINTLNGETAPSDLSAGIGFNSHYAWRGLNYLQANSQKDQHAYVSPWLSWAVGDSGWSVGYWGAYQATGSNIADMTAGASSHENDLWVDWSTDLAEGAFTANVYGLAYLYPFADSEVAGADVPAWVEPGAGLSWNGPVSLSAGAAWYQAVQEPLQGGEYLYLSSSVSGEHSVHEAISVGLGASAGYKAGLETTDNTLDLQLDWTMSVALDQLTVAPGTHVTWTNLEDAAPGEAYFVWWGVETEFAL